MTHPPPPTLAVCTRTISHDSSSSYPTPSVCTRTILNESPIVRDISSIINRSIMTHRFVGPLGGWHPRLLIQAMLRNTNNVT